MRNKRANTAGMTLVEIMLVVVIMAVLIIAVEPLVRTTYNSWITADRRVELTASGRVAMSKMVDEIRTAYDLYSATDSTYIDYYPMWATSTFYRFQYATSTTSYDIVYGVATPTFSSDSLAAPIDSFEYTSYTRRLVEGATRARRINAFRFVFTVSDERRLLPATLGLNPMHFRSQAQIRTSREGYQFAKSAVFSSESYRYDRSNNDEFCVKVFCDRVDRDSMTTMTTTLNFGGGVTRTLSLAYYATDDYFATCCAIGPAGCNFGLNNSTTVQIDLSDGTEWTTIRDIVQVVP